MSVMELDDAIRRAGACRYFKPDPVPDELLGIPDEFLTAATLALGYPEKPLPTKLTRRPASEVVFADRYGEPLFPT